MRLSTSKRSLSWTALLVVSSICYPTFSAVAFDCLDVPSQLSQAGLPELSGTSCPTSADLRYANRILNQSFKVNEAELLRFTVDYETQLRSRGWSIQPAPLDRRADGQLAVISAIDSKSRIADIVVKQVVDANSNKQLMVRVVVSVPSMSPEDQFNNQRLPKYEQKRSTH